MCKATSAAIVREGNECAVAVFGSSHRDARPSNSCLTDDSLSIKTVATTTTVGRGQLETQIVRTLTA